MYPWVVFVHVLAAFGFLLAHGASAAVIFKLRGERDRERIKALLDVSAYSLPVSTGALIVLFLTGILAGFMGNWWGQGWIWVSLGLLVAIGMAMGLLGSRYYNRLRNAVGLPSTWERNQPPPDPASEEEIVALCDSSRPLILAASGFGGIALITWLMMFKPF